MFKKNDFNKKMLALNNGIEHYYIIDARESNKDYLKESLLNNRISKLLDFSKIDWDLCEKAGVKNYVIDACDKWNNGSSIEEIAKELNKSVYTISNYLKKMKNTPWLNDYSFEEKNKRKMQYEGI